MYKEEDIINMMFLSTSVSSDFKEKNKDRVYQYHDVILKICNDFRLANEREQNVLDLIELLDELDKKKKLYLIDYELLEYLKDYDLLRLKDVNELLTLLLNPLMLYQKDVILYYKTFNQMFFSMTDYTINISMYDYSENVVLERLIEMNDIIEEFVNDTDYDISTYYNVYILRLIMAYYYLHMENNQYSLRELLNNYLKLEDVFKEEWQLNGITFAKEIGDVKEFASFFDDYASSGRFSNNCMTKKKE